MNRRSIYLSAAVIFAVLSLAASIIFVSAQAPQEADAPAQPEVALGQPGLSYRYVKTFGVTETPYFSDTIHINRPLGLFIDSSNNLFVTEEQGQRLLKFNASGAGQFAIGKAGICSTEDYSFCGINDAVTDSSGNIWAADGNRVVQYSAAGTFLQQFPEVDSWMSGSDNSRFNGVSGVALYDSGKLLYVSDRNNHRIQVFDLTTGSPVYSTTIGTAGVSGSGANQFNEPYRIAIDSNNNLFVADRMNNRVQQCTYSTSWTCTTLDNSLNRPQGVATDSGNNIYIADTENYRIRKCTSGGVCNDFANNTHGLYDVAVDSSERIYGSAAYEDIVVRYDSTGAWLGTFAGVEFVPYLTDSYHYNRPRVAIDHANNIIIVEEQGHRLIKLNPNGILLWKFGVPGVDAEDDTHLQWPNRVAVDKNNNIYVTSGCRIMIFSPAGAYLGPLGSSCGTGNYQFSYPNGVSVDDNGNIYVADNPNHRVMIYNSSKTYIGQIGVTGECSTANDHLCNPVSVDVDVNGDIYVTDRGNLRVQKFNISRIWQMTIGTGIEGEQFDQFNFPEDIAVDAQGRIFVSDWSNNRVQVFDPAGKYLTTIAGVWGTNSSQLKGAPGVNVDSQGNVYVADWDNARIQVFAPGVPGWKQVNINGFGNRLNSNMNSLEVFAGKLYAGTGNWSEGATIWRTSDGTDWTQVSNPGFSSTYTNTNPSIVDMVSYGNKLYAGTGWSGAPAQLWRSTDGTTWEQVMEGGFGNANNIALSSFTIINNQLYVTTHNLVDGLEIWRSVDGSIWTPVVTAGNGNKNNTFIGGIAEFNGAFYAAIENEPEGAQI